MLRGNSKVPIGMALISFCCVLCQKAHGVVFRGQYELKLALAAATGNGGKKSAHFHADGTVHEDDD